MIRNIEKYNLSLGDRVQLFDRDWQYIDNDLILLVGFAFRSKFDDFSNKFEGSIIQKKLKDWLRKQLNKFLPSNFTLFINDEIFNINTKDEVIQKIKEFSEYSTIKIVNNKTGYIKEINI